MFFHIKQRYENMVTGNINPGKKRFTKAEKALLNGVAQKIGTKRGCSGMYVRYLINGKRGANTPLAKEILQDLNDLLEFLKPVERKKKK